MATSSVSLKLFIDTKAKKVLFAEAGKDFVDFLFNLMALPVGTVTRLLTKDSMVGSLGNLYGSIESINESYLVGKDQTKEALLKPKLPSSSISQVPLLIDYQSVSRKVYVCSSGQYGHRNYISDDPNMVCPYAQCNYIMSCEVIFLSPSNSKVASSDKTSNDAQMGYVKEVVTYMVTDDLVVKPISSFAMLNSFDIKEFSALQEKVVHLDMVQGVKLLKSSMQSKTVLTTVFLCDTSA